MILITVDCGQEKIIFEVKDNGMGMEKEYLTNLNRELEKTDFSKRAVNQTGYGIFNINARIKNVFGVEYGSVSYTHLEMGYSSIVDPGNMGLTKEMDAIAATVLGGTSIDGGKTHIWGTVCGAIVLQMITIMVNMNNISSSYAKIIKAGIIILAVFLQNVKKKRRG